MTTKKLGTFRGEDIIGNEVAEKCFNEMSAELVYVNKTKTKLEQELFVKKSKSGYSNKEYLIGMCILLVGLIILITS